MSKTKEAILHRYKKWKISSYQQRNLNVFKTIF